MELITFWVNEIALLLSVFVYAQTMERRENFAKRLIGCTVVYVLLSSILNYLLARGIADEGIFTRLFWYLIVAGFFYFCWDIAKSVAFYYALWGFMSWQLLYELWMVLKSGRGEFLLPYEIGDVVGTILIYIAGYGIAGMTIGKWMPEGSKKIGPRQMSSALLIFWIFELVGMAQRRLEVGAGDSKWELLYLTQVLLAVVLYLQNELFKKSALKQELTLINLLHQKEQEQYQLAKEHIALIDQKCHDLKHQIRAIRKANKEDIEKYLDEVEESVGIYEAIVKTGNEVLDTILTEKSLYCNSRGITVSCVADGSQMDFINTMDLYSILGNAMDNAIEAVEQFEEEEKRQIDVVIYRRQNFLVLNITNPLSEPLNMVAGIPVSSKDDKRYHGFGIMSMKHVVKKYDGYLNIEEENGCFSLKILIPIPATT